MRRLKYGNTNTFFVQGSKSSLLVDTDYAGTLTAFYRALKQNDIRIKDIDYVMATHYHPDHMGLIGELMEQGVSDETLKTLVEGHEKLGIAFEFEDEDF
jgi:glyoxylase-like metal-dependent hydrolase (beta-lactamase superfamily II)